MYDIFSIQRTTLGKESVVQIFLVMNIMIENKLTTYAKVCANCVIKRSTQGGTFLKYELFIKLNFVHIFHIC